jgi:hypothetical protein
VGTNFATIFEVDRAHLRTADIELMRIFRPGKWKIDGTLGARHAHIGVERLPRLRRVHDRQLREPHATERL